MATSLNNFKHGQIIHVLECGKGTIIGFVGYPSPSSVRVQFDNGNVRDFHPIKLAAKLVTPLP